MIIVRDDDVLIRSSSHHNSFARFKCVHEIICKSNRLIHVPTILTDDIQDYPEAIEYIKHETWHSRMIPELHGLQHIDYGELTKDQVKEHLTEAAQWMYKTFGQLPHKWYTPWGASQLHLHEAAKECHLQLVDCSNTRKLKGRYGVKQLLADGKPTSFFEGEEIIMHWWNALDNERLIEFVEVLQNENILK